MNNAQTYLARWQALRQRAAAADANGVIVGGGTDLAYLTGHDGMSYERLTAAVANTDPDAGPALLVTPKLEAERITQVPEVFSLGPWEDADDPIALATSGLPSTGRVLVSDGLASSHLLGLQRALPEVCLLYTSDAADE